jgi:hypothetical protein
MALRGTMIILTHHTGEPHSILGSQVAATFLTKNLEKPAIVLGVTRDFVRDNLLEFLDDHYRGRERIICFSHLSGRKDLIELIGILRGDGFRTILAGPQAGQDYTGEQETDRYPLRFKGLKDTVHLAFDGPVDHFTRDHLSKELGYIRFPWGKEIFLQIDWENLYVFTDRPEKLTLKVAQVLRGIGCPYAKKQCTVKVDRPEFLDDESFVSEIETFGCTFCDVSRDKGFHGNLSDEAVLAQIKALPLVEGRKIPFELIDEYPVTYLSRLLRDAAREKLNISQINLVCRVDDITLHESVLGDVLLEARKMDVRIMFSSIGFESFSEKILRNFNKGITVSDIIECVKILRDLKSRFGDTILYRRDEGAIHGFIHPTPWDDGETMSEMNANIGIYGLFQDVLPDHSVPLIIHHSSYLGDWIRDVEARTNVRFNRDGTWIEWWTPLKDHGGK